MNEQVPLFRIAAEDKLVLRGIEYRVRRWLPTGYVLARVDDPQIVEEITHQQLHELSLRPDFRFERGAFDIAALATRLASDVDLVSELPPGEQEIVLWRHWFCVRFMRMEAEGSATRSDASMTRAIGEIQAALDEEKRARARAGQEISSRKPPAPRTLRTWLKAFEGAALRATSLRAAHRRCGDRKTERFPVEVRRLLRQFALQYASETKPSATDLHKLLVGEIEEINRKRGAASMPAWSVPSYDRLLRQIRSLPEFEIYAGRNGLPAAMKKFVMVGNGPDVERPLQRVEIDEWRINLMTIIQDIGLYETLTLEQQKELRSRRYWACVAIDVRTRIILGMRVAPSVSANLALETLEMVVTPKRSFAVDVNAGETWDQYGTPEEVVHDQGATFMSPTFRRALIDLGCNADAPPAGKPWLRGTIESSFRTIDRQALAPFTGRSFANITEKGDYDPVARASLTIAELCHVLVRWVVDIYHNTPHAGLGGETPANAWRRLVAKYGIIPAPDRHVRRAIFGIDIERVMSSRGVRALGLFYNCRELQEHRRRLGDVPIDVKLDPSDLGHVSVRVGEQGWVAVPCMRPGLDDVPASIWQAATADLRRRFAAEAALNNEVIAAAIRDAWEIARKAQARAGILSTRPTREELDHLERSIGLGFPAPGEQALVEIGAADLTAKAIPSGRPPVASPHPAKPSRIIKPKN